MKKTFEIVMLPTDEKIVIGNIILQRNISKTKSKLHIVDDIDKNKDGFYGVRGNIAITIDADVTPQHLYILSDEEIKEGDWFLDMNNLQESGIQKCTKRHLASFHKDGIDCKKIIASTDKSLKIGECDCICHKGENISHFQPCCYPEPLPTIPEEYIKYFIEQWNQGNKLETIKTGSFFGTRIFRTTEEIELKNNQVCPIIPIQDDVLDSIDPNEWDDGSDPANKDQSIIEAAEKQLKLIRPSDFHPTKLLDTLKWMFIFGANHQASKMYSEEEVLELLCKLDQNWWRDSYNTDWDEDNKLNVLEFFNQNKLK